MTKQKDSVANVPETGADGHSGTNPAGEPSRADHPPERKLTKRERKLLKQERLRERRRAREPEGEPKRGTAFHHDPVEHHLIAERDGQIMRTDLTGETMSPAALEPPTSAPASAKDDAPSPDAATRRPVHDGDMSFTNSTDPTPSGNAPVALTADPPPAAVTVGDVAPHPSDPSAGGLRSRSEISDREASSREPVDPASSHSMVRGDGAADGAVSGSGSSAEASEAADVTEQPGAELPVEPEFPGDGLKDEAAIAPVPSIAAGPVPQAAPRRSELNIPACGFFRRLAATLFDILFIVTVNVVAVAVYLGSLLNLFLRPLSATGPDPMFAPERTHELMLFVIGLVVFDYLYFTATECWPLRGTLGKHVFNLRVLATSKRSVSFFRSNYRLLCRVVTIGTLGLGYLMALIAPRRTLHDRLSRTVVVHLKDIERAAAIRTPRSQRPAP